MTESEINRRYGVIATRQIEPGAIRGVSLTDFELPDDMMMIEDVFGPSFVPKPEAYFNALRELVELVTSHPNAIVHLNRGGRPFRIRYEESSDTIYVIAW